MFTRFTIMTKKGEQQIELQYTISDVLDNNQWLLTFLFPLCPLRIVIFYLFYFLCHVMHIIFIHLSSEPEVGRGWYEMKFIHLFRLTNIVMLYKWRWSSINNRFIKLEKVSKIASVSPHHPTTMPHRFAFSSARKGKGDKNTRITHLASI